MEREEGQEKRRGEGEEKLITDIEVSIWQKSAYDHQQLPFQRGVHSPATAFTWQTSLICDLVPKNIWVCNLGFIHLSFPQLGKDILFTV